jgi:MFS family permease
VSTEATDARPPVRTTRTSAFWTYWSATAISTTGTGITAVALPLLTLTTLGASNFEMGLLTAATYAAAIIIGLPAGVIVGRYPLRTMLVRMDLFRALALLTVPLAAWAGHLTLAHILVVALLVGLAANLHDVASASFLPAIVSRDELSARNGLISGTFAVTTMAGPAAGGVLVQLIGAAGSIVADAVSYVASASLLVRIPPTMAPTAPARESERTSFGRQMSVGLAYVFGHPVLRPACLAAAAANFANGALFAVTVPFLVHTLGLAAGAVGLLLATDGLGTVVGAALTTPLARRIGSARTVLLVPVAAAVASLAMPLAHGALKVPAFAVGLAGFAVGTAVLSVVTRTHRQTVAPPHLLSRVLASVRFVSWSAIPVGALLAGVVAQLWGPRIGLVLTCVASFVGPAVLWASRVRALRDMTDGEPDQPAYA